MLYGFCKRSTMVFYFWAMMHYPVVDDAKRGRILGDIILLRFSRNFMNGSVIYVYMIMVVIINLCLYGLNVDTICYGMIWL